MGTYKVPTPPTMHGIWLEIASDPQRIDTFFGKAQTAQIMGHMSDYEALYILVTKLNKKL